MDTLHKSRKGSRSKRGRTHLATGMRLGKPMYDWYYPKTWIILVYTSTVEASSTGARPRLLEAKLLFSIILATNIWILIVCIMSLIHGFWELGERARVSTNNCSREPTHKGCNICICKALSRKARVLLFAQSNIFNYHNRISSHLAFLPNHILLKE